MFRIPAPLNETNLYLSHLFRSRIVTILKINTNCRDVARPGAINIQTTHHKMARNLDSWQHNMILHMICSKKALTISQIAQAAKCSERSATRIRRKMRLFGSARSPPVRVGRPPTITPVMLDALLDHLTRKTNPIR